MLREGNKHTTRICLCSDFRERTSTLSLSRSPVAARKDIIVGGEALADTLLRIAYSPVGAFCVLLSPLDGGIPVHAHDVKSGCQVLRTNKVESQTYLLGASLDREHCTQERLTPPWFDKQQRNICTCGRQDRHSTFDLDSTLETSRFWLHSTPTEVRSTSFCCKRTQWRLNRRKNCRLQQS